ncbi:MAG TPA: DMT family transporter [Candidatus Marinimicrobia bacterium]|nr:DMT family transporter [Candidatus Neomarinimicrobiota bacterium]
MNKSHFPILLYTLMILAMATWGLSWTNAKVLSDYGPSSVVVFWRFFFSSITMIPVLWLTGNDFRVTRQGMKYIFPGAVFISLYNIFFFVGTDRGSASVGGIIVPTFNPVITFIISVLLLKQVFSRKDIIGLVLGFTGGVIVLQAWTLSLEQMIANGNMYFICASISWGIMSVISGRSHGHVSTLSFSFWVYTISALIYLGVTWNKDILLIFTYDWIFWVNMFFLSAGAMVFGTTVYFLATTRLGPEKASAFIFMVPVTALLFSVLLIGERLEVTTMIGGIMTMTAVYLINKSHARQEPTD